MKSFVIIGCGRFGTTVARRLYELGQEVMVVDKNEEKINKIADSVTTAIVCDVTDENAVKELGLKNFDLSIISIAENLEAEIMAVLSCKEANIPRIIAKASDKRSGEILYRVGADKIIEPEKEMGYRLANSLSSKNIIDSIEISKDYSIVEINPLKNWINKEIDNLNIRQKYGCSIIFIVRSGEMIVNPPSDFIIREGDLITILGKNNDIDTLERENS